MNADRLLEALDPEQRAVASAPRGTMCVLAGAGTGKTRAITHRIAYGVASGVLTAQQVLAVTFTARAAGEMRARLRDLGAPGVQTRTFHAAALRQLQFFWPRVVGGPPPEVMPHKAGAVAEAGGRLRLGLGRTEVRDLAAEIEWAKVSMLTPEGYRRAPGVGGKRPGGLDVTAVQRLWETYEEVKAERGAIDFEDVLLLTVGMLDAHPEVLAAVREQYRHVVVDEYQDVNAVQQRLLELWVGDRSDLCVVGDPAQTIYSFTGADPRHLLQFTRRYPDAAVVRLERNYRSTPQIVSLANVVLHGPGAGRASADPAREGGMVVLQAQRPAGPAPQVRRHADDTAEADAVAQAVAGLAGDGSDTPLAEVAVLYRTNAQSEALENAFAAAGVPYLLRGGERYFSRTEVRQALVLLRGHVRSADPDAALGQVVRDVLTGAGWSTTPPASGGATRERWESLEALARLADELAGSLADFVAELDRRSAEQHAPTVQGVTLASLHAAKGLEWDVVFLVGASEGLLPISFAETPEQVAEERRLFYVGLTRARRELHLSYAEARTPGARATRRPTRFLDTAWERVEAGPGARPEQESRGGSGGRPGRGRAPKAPQACRTCGSRLDSAAERKIGRCAQCPPTYDEAVFEALRAWRLERSRAAGLPAFTVFTDATLVAIAERRPRDLPALNAISGVGARKLAEYGSEVLAVLADGAAADPSGTGPAGSAEDSA